MPTGRSNPPSISEWSNAPLVNTQGANSHPDNCRMQVWREWVSIKCEGDFVGFDDDTNLGVNTQDWFRASQAGKYASVVIRMKKGSTQKIRICRRKDRASLFVNWPNTRDRPRHIALGKAGPCEQWWN